MSRFNLEVSIANRLIRLKRFETAISKYSENSYERFRHHRNVMKAIYGDTYGFDFQALPEPVTNGFITIELDKPSTKILDFFVDLLADQRSLKIPNFLKAFEGNYLSPLVRRFYDLCDATLINTHINKHYAIWNVVIKLDHSDLRTPKSMSWHYDTHYPPQYFKIHFGLNKFEEHRGGTYFLSESDSEKFSKKYGYFGIPTSKRFANLDGIREFQDDIFFYKSDYGKAAVFYPSRSLHSGFLPPGGRRKSLFFSCFPLPESIELSREEITRLVFTSCRDLPDGLDSPVSLLEVN